MNAKQKQALKKLLEDFQKPLNQGPEGEREAIVRMIEILLSQN